MNRVFIGRDGSALTAIRRETITLTAPVFSPDGNAVRYLVTRYSGSGLVSQKVNAAGQADGGAQMLRGSNRRVMQHLSGARGAMLLSWSLIERSSDLVSIKLDARGNPTNEEPVNLTRNERTLASFPSFSPDGSKVAWCAIDADDDSGVWIANADGSNPKPLSVGPQLKQNTQWSRNPWEVFYSAWESGPVLMAISLMNGQTNRVGNLPAGASGPRISPDRETIAFNQSAAGSVTVWATAVDGSGVRQLNDRPGVLARNPIWSPSGKNLAVQVRRPDGTSAVGVLPAAGGKVRVLDTTGEAIPYSWSPDERFIAYAGFDDGVWNIWSVAVATGKARRLTSNSSPERWLRFPAWSPDGTRIIFESGVTESEIWVSNPPALQ